MNKIAAVVGLCVFCAVSSFAQIHPITKLSKLERSVRLAKVTYKSSLSRVVNGYLHTPAVTRLSLPTGESLRVVRFSRDTGLKKEDLFVPKGSVAVVDSRGQITLYAPNEKLPTEIQAGLDAATPELLDFVLEPTQALPAQPSKPWTGKLTYDNQIELAKDIDAYYEGKAEETIFNTVTRLEGKVYRIPSGDIYYQPAGNSGRYLNPDEDLIVFYPAKNDGQILLKGLTSNTWRMFCIPQP